MPAVHLIIKGKVQGVFFRASAKDQAEKLKINGWVKNTPEGDVEITASGDDEALEKFINWCRRGPSNAKVTSVSLNEIDADDLRGFRIVR
jgi:acylphosphatase